MQRMVIRLSTALITFALGVAAAAIYHLDEATPTIPTIEPRIEITLTPPDAATCHPVGTVATSTMDENLYFPLRVFSENDQSDQGYADWFSRYLKAMNEQPLHSLDEEGESYRFLWLRTFHSPVAVRIWRCGTERFISVKEMSGMGGYDPGNLIVNQERELTDAEWTGLMRLLDDSCFWQLPTAKAIIATDGAQWVFEGVKDGNYHVVNRWSPHGGTYRELCLYALELSGLKFDQIY